MLTKPVAIVFALVVGLPLALSVPLNQTEASIEVEGAEAIIDGNVGVEARATEKYGRGTVYQQFGVAGSCGSVHKDSDFIVALSHTYMEHQYKNYHCGKKVRVYNTGSNDVNVKGKGTNIVATVADSCDGCGADDIDLSIGAWNKITSNSAYSTFKAQWHFMD